MTDQTPSPHSVVVDTFNGDNAALVRSIAALLTMKNLTPPVPGLARQLLATSAARLAAAPAPSSLAGGDVTNDQIQSVMLAAIKEVRATVTDATEGASMDADIIRMERGTVDMGDTGWAVMRAVHRRLAALSPEAPAREGE